MLSAAGARSARMFVISLALLVGLLAAPPATVAQEGQYSAPRTPWGAPDLSGVWSNATTTPLQRPADLEGQEFLTEEERAARNPDSGVSAEERSAFMPTGAYNDFWLEQGEFNLRTSLVIDPPDGRLPSLTGPEQRRQRGLPNSFSPTQQFDSWFDFNAYDRCITRGGVMIAGSEHLRTVERLTRVGDNVINYEITVTDPTVWEAPWTVAVPMTMKDEPIYEYACHEGNYALPNILSGQRAQDAETAPR